MVYLPSLAGVFDTRPLGWSDWSMVLGASALTLLLGQAAKIRRHSAG